MSWAASQLAFQPCPEYWFTVGQLSNYQTLQTILSSIESWCQILTWGIFRFPLIVASYPWHKLWNPSMAVTPRILQVRGFLKFGNSAAHLLRNLLAPSWTEHEEGAKDERDAVLVGESVTCLTAIWCITKPLQFKPSAKDWQELNLGLVSVELKLQEFVQTC